jgi:hypothetical protein
MSRDQSSEGSAARADAKKPGVVKMSKEDAMCSALGINMSEHAISGVKLSTAREIEHVVIPNPTAESVDLSDLRGIKAPGERQRKCLWYSS